MLPLVAPATGLCKTDVSSVSHKCPAVIRSKQRVGWFHSLGAHHHHNINNNNRYQLNPGRDAVDRFIASGGGGGVVGEAGFVFCVLLKWMEKGES